MQLYFIKATFTNNVYKLSDFFIGNDYKLTATKMLDINFRPDDGLSSFITSKIILPDETSIRNHTHIIVPEYEKIYRIAAIDYVNVDQYNVTLDEDPLIGNYQTLKATDIILMRSNDAAQFRGVNDINDLTLKETIETKVMTSTAKTGKWALIFMQYNTNKTRYGLKFKANIPKINYPTYATLTAILAAFPEVTTTTPNLYEYFQKIVYNQDDLKLYQCVYNTTKLFWTEYTQSDVTNVYFDLADTAGSRLAVTDVMNLVVALPFENDFISLDDKRLLSFNNFIGPIDSGDTIDIKVVDDIVMPLTISTYSVVGRVIEKTVGGNYWAVPLYENVSGTGTITNYVVASLSSMITDVQLNPGYISGTPDPLHAEPFRHYDLYIFGKKYPIPYYLTDSLRLLIAFNSGVINYTVYYGDKRYILAAGSFTHSIRYQVDKLDQFYNQNPTYRDQFFVKMATDSIKTVAGGAIGGAVVGGVGAVGGAGLGLVAAGVDAGLSMINLHFQEKSLRLQPDQIFGEISELTLQLLNIFGIYFVKRTSQNEDLMKVEYDLRGFPTTKVIKISDLVVANGFLGNAKVVYGELKSVIKNEFTTGFINQKLKEGVVLI